MNDANAARRSSSPWLTRLDDAPNGLELPADRPRPAALGRRLDVVRIDLDAEVAQQVHAMADGPVAGTNAVFLALWQAVLARHVDERDLVIGCVPPAELTAGPDTWLVVRSTVDPSSSFQQLVKAAAEDWADAARTPVTMDELLTALAVEPGPGKHPVFQVALAGPAGPAEAAIAAGDAQLAPCDLTLRWALGAGGLQLELHHSPDLFDQRRAERMLTRAGVLLRSALADPARPVQDLELLGPDEPITLRRWNDTGHAHDATRTVASLFAEQVERTPDAAAVELGDDVLTYRQLDERANQLAHLLVEHGVGPDETVAVSMERSLDMAVAVLAVLKAGGAYVPIDPAYPPARRQYMVDNARARVVLTDGSTDADAGGGDAQVVNVGQGDASADRPRTAPRSAATGEHLGYVIFTSGSTGEPKGVALPQRALTNLIEWQLRRPGFEAGRRTLQFASLSFDVSFQELFTTWCSGGTLVLVADRTRRDPRSLLEHLRAHRVARVFLPFVALRGLADAAAASGSTPTTLREVYTAGEQLVVDEAIRQFFTDLPGCLLENQYGPSETHVVTAHRLDGDPATWPTLPPIGAPIANSTAAVLDANGHLAPIGVPGELFLGGVCLAREYLGRPDLTAERFVERDEAAPGQRLYRTGDLARWTEDGVLEFLGRIDHQVKFRGFRIEPGEVASVLSGFPGVRQCVASVVELEGIGPRLAAYFVPRDGAELSLQALHAHARDHLPDYMVPSHYVVLDELPMTPSGKVDTAGLPRPTFDRSILSAPYVAPTDPIQWALAEMWEQLLGVSEVGRDDDFFELGGDSLMAVELFLQIEERFGHDLPLGALAQAPTVGTLGRLIRLADAGGAWQPLVQLQEGGDKTPLFCVHGGSGNIASLPKLARALPADQPMYALQWDGLSGRGGARTIEAMAERYLADVRTVQPEGPYLLAGQCIGGLVAREMAHQLVDDGQEVALLVMYESPNLATRHFHPLPGLPALPATIDAPVRRVLGAALWWYHLAKGRPDRGQLVRTRLRDLTRRRVPTDDRYHFGSRVMMRAAWRHSPKAVPAPTLYVHTGLRKAGNMSLTGTWDDGMLGWSDHVSDRFAVLQVRAGHNEVPYAPGALERLVDELDRFHVSRTTG